MNLLILLIGSNPLPNYVVASYLLNKSRDNFEKNEKLKIPDKILSVYSSQTEKYKDNITKLLEKKDKISSGKLIDCCNLGDKARDYNFIKKQIMRKLDELNYKTIIRSINLLYTGGTKPMAVAVSSAVNEYVSKNLGIENINCDINPDEFKIQLREGEMYPTEGDLRKYLKMNILEIYTIHGLSEPKYKTEHGTLYEDNLEGIIRSFYEKNNIYYEWQNWPKESKRGDLRNVYKKEMDLRQSADEAIDERLIELQGKLLKTLDHFPKIRNLLFEGLEKSENLNNWKTARAFLTGEWLEQFIFDIINEVKTNNKELLINDIGWNVVKSGQGCFEIDVIFIAGFQSFLVTCTTSDKKNLIKGKAFEGIFRSLQLGGEHSKTIIVCLGDDGIINAVNDDLDQFDAKNNISILGYNDIIKETLIKSRESLISKFYNIIKGN